MTSELPTPRRWLVPLGFVAFYLLLARGWIGLSFWDDSIYFWQAPRIHLRDLIFRYDTAPLYSLWLKLLHHAVHDPVRWYMTSWALLVVAISCIALVFRLRLAWAYTLLLLLAPFFEVVVYVSHFAAFFLACGAAAVLRFRLSSARAAVVATIACLPAAFGRPEFAYGVVLSATVALVAIVLEPRRERPVRQLGMGLLVVALAAFMFLCVKQTASKRSGFAFSQHMSMRAGRKGIIPATGSWNSQYAMRLFHIEPTAIPHVPNGSIGDFFRANPRLFLRNTMENLREPRTLAALAVFLAVALGAWFRRGRQDLRPAVLYLVLVGFPVLAAIVLIYPRPHYLMSVLPSVLLVAVALLPERTAWVERWPWLLFAGGVALIALKVHVRHSHPPAFNTASQENTALVRCLRSVEQQSPVGSGALLDLATNAFTNVYFREPPRRIEETPADWASYQRLVETVRPTWIVQLENPGLPGADAAAMTRFLVQQMGYSPHPCPGSDDDVIYTLPAPAGEGSR